MPASRARASPSEAGSTPTTATSSRLGFRRTLYMRSVPMFPDPMIVTRSELTNERSLRFRECHLRSLEPVLVPANAEIDEDRGADGEPDRKEDRRVLLWRRRQRHGRLITHDTNGDGRNDRDHEMQDRIETTAGFGQVVPCNADVGEDVHDDQPEGDHD